jgi:hypothetical protein
LQPKKRHAALFFILFLLIDAESTEKHGKKLFEFEVGLMLDPRTNVILEASFWHLARHCRSKSFLILEKIPAE